MLPDAVDDVAIYEGIFGCIVNLQPNTPLKSLYLNREVRKFFDDGIAVVAFRAGI